MWDLSAATVWAVKSFVYGCCWGCLPPEGFALHPVLLVIPPSSLPWEAFLLGGRSEGAWVPCYSTRVWAVSRQWMSSPFSEDANTYVSVLLWDVVAQAFSSALFACRESEMCLSSTCFCLVPFLSRALLLPFIQTLWSFFCSFAMISFFKISWYLQIHLPHFPTHWSDGKAIHIILCHLRVVWKRAVWLHIQGEDSFWVTPVPIAASDLPLLLFILQGICARKLLGNEWQQGERAHQTASCVGSSPGKRLSWVWKNKTPNPNRIRRSHRSSYLWVMVPFFSGSSKADALM